MADRNSTRISVFNGIRGFLAGAVVTCALTSLVTFGVCLLEDRLDEEWTTLKFIALCSAIFGGCAGGTTYAPRGSYRFVSSLAIVAFSTVVTWMSFLYPYVSSIAYRNGNYAKMNEEAPPMTERELFEACVAIAVFVAIPLVVTTTVTIVRAANRNA